MSDRVPGATPGAAPKKSEPPQKRLAAWLTGPTFAYLSILALQFRVMWGFWDGRDLPTGDTSFYAVDAFKMANLLGNNFTWSPLYTTFYAATLRATGDIVTATFAHRVILVLLIACLVLNLARQLLPAPVSWLVTAWWVLIPTVFNSLYEVHLFAAILPLSAAIVVARRQDRVHRALALMLLLLSAGLVRNEHGLAFAAFLAVCAAFESRRWRNPETRESIRKVLLPYVVTVTLAALVILGFLKDSIIQGDQLRASFNTREELVVCQFYAIGYVQRDPEWLPSPFTECRKLMKSQFSEVPHSFVDAARLDSNAFLEHVAWNVRLIPAGLQLALFGQIAGEVSPDFVPVSHNKLLPGVLSVLLLCLATAGAFSLKKDHVYWQLWIGNRSWPFIVLGCCSLTAVPIMLLLRPRPAYFFPFTLLMMLFVGLCAAALLARLNISRLATLLIPLAMFFLLIFSPSPYAKGTRPTLNAFYRLQPSAQSIGSGVAALVPFSSADLCNYLLPDGHCRMIDFRGPLKSRAQLSSLRRVLEEERIGLIYADAGMLADPTFQAEFRNLPPGWSLQAGDLRSSDPWAILVRQ